MDNQPEDLSVSGSAAATKKRKTDLEEDEDACLDLSPNKKKTNSSVGDCVDAVKISPNNVVALQIDSLGNLTKENIKKTKNEEQEQVGPFKTFEGFKVDGVLSNSADYKRIVVEGSIGEEKAVIILDKKPFTDEILSDLFSKKSELIHTFQNDIYGSYDCVLEPKLSAVKTTIVHPATQKHIDKYRIQPFYLVQETCELYKSVTLPYLESSSFDIQWVFNILDHKKETDRIVFENPDPKTGFILLPDLKWDGKTVENLYLVGIIHEKGIKSLRDLTAEHIPLLEAVLSEGSKAIEKKYGLTESQLRIYIHYQPSYYHLHIHFTALGFNAPGISTEKSHLLQSVIGNIRLSPTYYQDITLPFTVKKGDALHKKLLENGYKF